MFNKRDLRQEALKYESILKNIKVALFDVDGILTDGKLYYSGEEVGFNRFFHTQDGYGMKVLMQAGLKVGIISGGNSLGVKNRFELLGVDYLYLGNEDKRSAYLDIKEKTGFSDEQFCYMGDEFFDLPILKTVGFSATVPSASHEIQESVHYVTQVLPGQGCAREIIDMIRYAQDITPKIEFF
jgi:3-deoxy-D-manno-octulosonate 8-phosphate phosphatase (KDO 8-P phosphatase)